jgi:hypothetical protein
MFHCNFSSIFSRLKVIRFIELAETAAFGSNLFFFILWPQASFGMVMAPKRAELWAKNASFEPPTMYSSDALFNWALDEETSEKLIIIKSHLHGAPSFCACNNINIFRHLAALIIHLKFGGDRFRGVLKLKQIKLDAFPHRNVYDRYQSDLSCRAHAALLITFKVNSGATFPAI